MVADHRPRKTTARSGGGPIRVQANVQLAMPSALPARETAPDLFTSAGPTELENGCGRHFHQWWVRITSGCAVIQTQNTACRESVKLGPNRLLVPVVSSMRMQEVQLAMPSALPARETAPDLFPSAGPTELENGCGRHFHQWWKG